VEQKLPAHLRTEGGQYYRPLQNAWEGLNYHLFGTNPVGWHVTSVLLHASVVVLVFRLAQLLAASTGVALLAALLFGVLGAHAEPVVWASSVTEPLSAFFQLAAFCLFIGAYRSGTRRLGLLGPLLLFALAMLSHESATVFPVLVAAYVFLFEGPHSDAGGKPQAGTPISLLRRMGGDSRGPRRSLPSRFFISQFGRWCWAPKTSSDLCTI